MAPKAGANTRHKAGPTAADVGRMTVGEYLKKHWETQRRHMQTRHEEDMRVFDASVDKAKEEIREEAEKRIRELTAMLDAPQRS